MSQQCGVAVIYDVHIISKMLIYLVFHHLKTCLMFILHTTSGNS